MFQLRVVAGIRSRTVPAHSSLRDKHTWGIAAADGLAERRFEFIPLWGVLVFLLYTMRRVNCRRYGIVAVEEVPRDPVNAQ